MIRRTGASSGDLVSDMHAATRLVCTSKMPDMTTRLRGRNEAADKGARYPAQPLWNVSPEAKARIEANTQPDIRQWITTVMADVTFVDDACFSFEADNPVSLVDKASELLRIVDETCEAHGLVVNIHDGKTEFSTK